MKRRFTSDEKKAYYEKKHALLQQATEAMKANTVTPSMFNQAGKHYSAMNCWMIAMQHGKPGAYAGFVAWQNEGRQVKKGAHGVSITCPRMGKDSQGNPEMQGVTYATVFHIDDTEAKETKEIVNSEAASLAFPLPALL